MERGEWHLNHGILQPYQRIILKVMVIWSICASGELTLQNTGNEILTNGIHGVEIMSEIGNAELTGNLIENNKQMG